MTKLVQALHLGGAYSCVEIVDTIYFALMRRDSDGRSPDTFLLSKGHGCMIQYAVLEELGILPRSELDQFCKGGGILGVHPDYQNPGIEASTGALGHGLAMAVGMAYAEKAKGRDGIVYCVLSDGEAQEGSVWEATLMASSLGLGNLVVFMDNNDFQSLERTSKSHPSFYPVVEKFRAFGWESHEVPGHDSQAIYDAVVSREGNRPLMVVCRTVKGKGVSYMENVAIWHYRSPSPAEYELAMTELADPS
ncbi:MAG: transketolase [Alphaproteobacteria bacterium]